MRWGIVILLGVLLVANAVALDVYVDGPGDGDGNSIDEHDTIRDALIELGATVGPYVTHEVHIMVDRLTEQPGLLLNGTADLIEGHSTLSEPVIVEGDADGNGVRCVVDFNASAPTIEGRDAFIHILLVPWQSVTLRDLTVMPTYRGFDIAQDFINVWKGFDGIAINDAVLTLERFTLTASNASNEPQDPDIPNSNLTRITDGFNQHVVLRMFPDAQWAGATLNLRDCVFAHQQAGTVYFDVQNGQLNVSDTRITRCGFFVSGVTYGAGIDFRSIGTAQINLDHVTIDNNWGEGLSITNARDAERRLEAFIGPGCQFNGNSERGMWIDDVPGHSGMFRAVIAGTEEEPVEMIGNGLWGCQLDPNEDSSFSIDHAVIAENLWWGMHLVPEPVSGDSNLITNTLIANNGVYPANKFGDLGLALNCKVSVEETASGPVSVEFRDCTIHDVVSPRVSEFIDSINLAVASDSPFGCEVVLTNCIVSGASAEFAFDLSDGEGNVVTLNNTCVVLSGEHAIGELRPDESGTINFNDTLFIDPQYVNTVTPPDGDSFDVRQPLFVTAGPASAPLTGWGDFIGDMYDHAGLVFH